MALFANDGFWAIRTVNDVIALVGFALAIISIWFSWWLSKRDLENRIGRAHRESIVRMRIVTIRSDMSRIHWLLREARQAYQSSDLNRTLDRCEWSEYFLSQLRIDDETSTDIAGLVHNCEDDLRLIARAVTKQLKDASGTIASETQLKRFARVLQRLSKLKSLIEDRLLRYVDGRPQS